MHNERLCLITSLSELVSRQTRSDVAVCKAKTIVGKWLHNGAPIEAGISANWQSYCPKVNTEQLLFVSTFRVLSRNRLRGEGEMVKGNAP